MRTQRKTGKQIAAAAAVTLIALAASCGRLTLVDQKDRAIQQVYKAPLTADQIYDRTLEWLARNLPSRGDSIEIKDRSRKKIIARGSGKYSEYLNFFVDRQFTYTVVIEMKEGKYRVTFENLVVYYEEREVKSSPARYKFEIDNIRKKLVKVADEMHAFVLRGADDWNPEKEKSGQDDW